MTERLTLSGLLARYPAYDTAAVDASFAQALKANHQKIVVLDDDPTGIQTVHNISVYTDWAEETIEQGFTEQTRMFFVLTNSRSFTEEQTQKAHREIARAVMRAAQKSGKPALIISRGDSTLRGHYPLETEVLRRTLEEEGHPPFDGEIILPFFPEGGRYTADNIHYVNLNGCLTLAGETEFAQDKTFGYRSSNLCDWVEEKTAGRYKHSEVTCISLDELRRCDYASIENKLAAVSHFGKVVVNALDYNDITVFATALLRVIAQGKYFLFRTAAAFVKVIGGIKRRPLLTRNELIAHDNHHGGLIIAGSFTNKTTEQLKLLTELQAVEQVIFDQHLVLNDAAFAAEQKRVKGLCERLIEQGKTVVVMTRRERIDLNTGNPEDELNIAVKISGALTGIVQNLSVEPQFLVAKGGITSSDIGVKGLGVKRALVLGQILPGIPVWQTGGESRFPGMPYIIFPGNVGDPSDLRRVVEVFLENIQHS